MIKPVYLHVTLLILVPFLSYVFSTTTGLSLNNAKNVVAGQSATYNCSSNGNGVNPTIQWSIRTTDGTVVRSNAQLSSTVVSGASVNDGAIKSSVTFTVQSSYLTNHRLWCSAVDAGQSSATMQIYTAISAATTTTASLGGVCSSSTTCSTANAGCVSNVCRCNTNYYDTNGDSNSGGSCSLQVGLGGTCTAGIDASCYTSNSRCSSTSPYICVCSSGYVQSGLSCVAESARINQACIDPTKICVTNAACTNGTCQCLSGYIYSSSFGYCVPSSAGINQACTNPIRTCVANVTCTNGACQCISGYTYSNFLDYCVSSSAGFNQACMDPTRTCVTNAGCTNGTCQCLSGYIYSNSLDYCVSSSAGINQACIDPTKTCATNAACISGTCQCLSGYIYSHSFGYCVPSSAGINQACTDPTRTCVTNAACTSGTCQCLSGNIYSNSFGYCVSSSVGINRACSNPTRTCPNNADCSSGTCQCLSGYTYSSSRGYCVANAEINFLRHLDVKTSMSSTAHNWSLDLAIDGKIGPDPICNCCSGTYNSQMSWWMADLGQQYPINSITVYSRNEEQFYQHLTGFQVFLANKTGQNYFHLLEKYTRKLVGDKHVITFSSTLRRYIKIQRSGVLTLCEVTVTKGVEDVNSGTQPGNANENSAYLLAGAVGGSVAVLIIIVLSITVVVLVLRKRNSESNKTQYSTPDSRINNTDSEYDTLDNINGNTSQADTTGYENAITTDL